ncbi:hypothetical protein ABW19_dt0202091 [Dactylella cylindrospora]|nr:hypothetical protein ABW19_dt0202091 [Dactylella cylindrospora]
MLTEPLLKKRSTSKEENCKALQVLHPNWYLFLSCPSFCLVFISQRYVSVLEDLSGDYPYLRVIGGYPCCGTPPMPSCWGSCKGTWNRLLTMLPSYDGKNNYLGKCVRGNTCPYIHDPDRVAICPKFLQNSCPDGDSCDLSHIPNPHRVPACVHFLRGNCSNESCKYAHIRVNPSAPICRPFAKEGYCDKGADCQDKHVFECPDFDEKGVCKDKACKLSHIEHAGRRRAAAAAAAKAKQSSEESDVSSDEEDDEEEEEDQIDSDDVDSDYFSDNEVILPASDDDHEVSQQADFIRF